MAEGRHVLEYGEKVACGWHSEPYLFTFIYLYLTRKIPFRLKTPFSMES